MDFQERMEKFQKMIDESKKVVFLGGAGVSTASGIPDFRSKNGLYNQKDVRFDGYEPEYLLSKECLYDHPEVFFEFYRQKLDCRDIKPNPTHYKLAEMEQKGKLTAVITQNIDGLHQKAGSENVCEIHGSAKTVYCKHCKKRYDWNVIFNSNDAIPVCENCGEMLRPDIVLYNETPKMDAWADAVNALIVADLFIIGGTSLTVYPANTMTQYYFGENMVIINEHETMHDEYANIIFREDITEVFQKIKI